MIFILTNIRYGHPKLFSKQSDFFHEFCLMLNKQEDGNKVFIRGDLFFNNHNPPLHVVNNMKKYLLAMNQCANVVIETKSMGNLFPLFLEVLKCGDLDDDIEIKDSVSLFQLTKESQDKIGYHVVKNEKVSFVENKSTPRFVEYIIDNIEDLENVNLNKDIIDLTINSELLNNQQYKNKIDIFLNNNKFNNVFYTEQVKEEEKVKLDSKNINIRNILIDNIDEELKDELKEIFVIYDQKITN